LKRIIQLQALGLDALKIIFRTLNVFTGF